MENFTPSYFSILIADVRYNKLLSASEKIFYSEITALTNNKGFCSASNSYFAELYSVDVRTITRWLHNLSELGYILIKIENKTRKIFLPLSLNKNKKKNTKKKNTCNKPDWIIEYEKNFEKTVVNL